MVNKEIRKITDFMSLAWENFEHRGFRSWLTMIGIFIGIAAVVSLVSLGQGLQGTINKQFQNLGGDKLYISAGTSIFSSLGTQASELTKDDLDVIKKVPGVKIVTGMIYKLMRVEYKNEKKYTFVIGMPTDEGRIVVESIQSLKLQDGRELKKSDKYKTVIGYLLYTKDLFSKSVPVGGDLIMGGKRFQVVGAYQSIGNPSDDQQIYINIDVAREIFQEPNKYDFIMAQVDAGTDPQLVADRITKDLRQKRGLAKGEEDFSVQTSKDLISAFNTVLTIVQLVVIGIAAISLFVGGVGITNTMYTAVLERTREIGIMKAIGARNSDIFKIFLIESGMLGLGGAIIGVVIGAGFSKLVAFGAATALKSSIFQAAFPWYLIVGSLAFGFFVGAIAGLTPALQAASQKPVESLRYE